MFKKRFIYICTCLIQLYVYTQNTLKLKDINIAYHNILLLVCWKSIIITK